MAYYFENYGEYGKILNGEKVTINTSSINKITWQEHFNNTFCLLLDAIETDEIQNSFINVIFDNGEEIELSVIDYWFNIIMWKLIVSCDERIKCEHIFFDEAITRKSIKRFIDKFFIEKYKETISNYDLNNIIDDTLSALNFIDRFSFYLANTINIEDTIMLMKKDPEFYSLMHMDLSNVPIEEVKTEGMKQTNRAIEIMKNSRHILGYDHCLADSWRSNEAINPRQYKEFAHNIGTKPDNRGGVFPEIINRSFLSGGVKDPMSLFIESYTGRVAQILSKTNVGDSGHFARLLGLNNTDTILHPDPHYVCDSKNFEVITIKDKLSLIMLKDRWYRMSPNGVEKIIKDTDEFLIGKTIYLRSPITCSSNSRGHGVCYRCYGNLAYTNADINIGKYAAEIISSKLTQTLLSAKHLLETKVVKLEWNKEFDEYCEIEGNIIKLSQDISTTKGYELLIDPENIMLENEEDYRHSDEYDSGDMQIYNEYISEFILKTPDGEEISFHTKDYDKLYISEELNEIIRKNSEPINNKIVINCSHLTDKFLFFIIIQNNELSKTMNKIMDIINKKAVTLSMDRHQLLQSFIDTIIEGGLDIDAVHLEIILSNQIRNIDDVLELPDWSNIDEPYSVLTLDRSLTENPSVTKTLMYQKLSRTLYNPLTFRKNKPSFMDLFFMDKPQEYLNNDTIVKSKEENIEQNIVQPIIISSDYNED